MEYLLYAFIANIVKKKEKRLLLIEFRRFAEALTTSYSSGKNTMEAFSESYQTY